MPEGTHLNQSGSDYHVPVMLQEVIVGLAIKPDGVYVDCTFGGGGHSRAMLNELGPKGKLIVFDQDADAKANAPEDERLIFVGENFRHLQKFLRLHRISGVDGLLADLGVSSHQFDEGERGFSIRFDATLDMRMDRRSSLTAAEVLKTYSESALHKLFERYGEVTNAKTLANKIVSFRSSGNLNTIFEFRQAIADVVKGNPNKYLAQVFQALRIEVNDEMGALRDMLSQLNEVIVKDGRVCIITFHSLEDRLVKQFFKTGQVEKVQEDVLFGGVQKSGWEIVGKKPVEASTSEQKLNPRSRSAKLRIAIKK